MKILVTGGAGFIGSHVVDRYIDEGFQVIVVDNLATGRRRNVNPRATFYHVDIRDAVHLADIFEREQPDVVNHHAAEADISITNQKPLSAAETNVVGLINVLENSIRYGIEKIIFISTSAVYGEPICLPIDEGHPLNPTTPYGITKVAGEQFVRFFGEAYGLDWIILRCGNAYGPRQNPRGEAGVISIFTRRLLAGETCKITWNGEQSKDYVYVSDLARANMLALRRGSKGVYNIGTGIETSVNHIFRILARKIDPTAQPVHVPKRAGDIASIYFDSTTARRELGWEAMVKLEEGMGHVVNYYRNKPVIPD